MVAAVAEGLATTGGHRSSALGSPPIIVVAAAGQDLPALDGVTITRDRVTGEGPLRGMEAGLEALQGQAEAAYVASCDTPLLRPAFVARMVALLQENDIAVPVVEGRYHPLAGVYRTTLLPAIRELLARERRRPFFLFEACRTRRVSPAEWADADPDMSSLRNINTPEDYRRLTAALAGGK